MANNNVSIPHYEELSRDPGKGRTTKTLIGPGGWEIKPFNFGPGWTRQGELDRDAIWQVEQSLKLDKTGAFRAAIKKLLE